MSRSPFSDYLQVYPFWLMDLGPSDTVALPLLTPLYGFSSITAPEITLETQEVIDGTFFLNKKAIKRGNVGNITLSQGITFYNSDFWRWTTNTLSGDMNDQKLLSLVPVGGPTYRRSLMLIQYMSRVSFNVRPRGESAASDVLAGLTSALVVGGAAGTAAGLDGSSGGAAVVSGLLAGFGAALGAAGVGPFEFAARVPAKAWILKNCIPVRWKSGNDFDAQSNSISIGELELAVEIIEEFAMGA
jgi:phage tail-like protein